MNKRFLKLLLGLLVIYSNILCEFSAIPEDYQKIECTIKRVPMSKRITRQISRPYIRSRSGRGNSPNWSGYIAATNIQQPNKNAVKQVSGTWKIPQITKSNRDTYSAFWVGIDGYASHTVEQIGTSHHWINGKQENVAWFEMFPLPPYYMRNFPVDVGDSITGVVEFVGNYVFKLTLFNNTKKVYTVVPSVYTKSYTAQRISAEWIAEPPVASTGPLPLANFGTASFTDCQANINGVSGGINNKAWAHDPTTMVSEKGQPKAVPSTLSADGKNFTIDWKSE